MFFFHTDNSGFSAALGETDSVCVFNVVLSTLSCSS